MELHRSTASDTRREDAGVVHDLSVETTTNNIMSTMNPSDMSSVSAAAEPHVKPSSSGRLSAAPNERRAPSTLDCKKSSGLNVIDLDVVAQKEDELCGWGPFRPQCCQILRNAKVVLFFLCILATVQGMVINGFVSVVISTIEKRFHLASRESGFIASGYDIASVICLIPVSYFGGVGHRPRWIAAGVLLLSLGSFMFAMPHFITDFYTYDELQVEESSTCVATSASFLSSFGVGDNVSADNGPGVSIVVDLSLKTEHATSNLSGYMFVLVVAQMLHGIGATPIYTLAVIYLNENLKPEVAPMYLGIFYTTAIIGPAIGYVLGGKLLEVYCDIGSVDMSTIDLTPSDPRWVGAWWIGFLISGCLSFLIAIPLSAFPRVLPGSNRSIPQSEPVVDGSNGSDVSATKPGFRMSLREIPASLKTLLCNATFMSLNLSGACEGMLVSGFIVFTPKFVESQFSITAAWAAQLIGMVTIPCGGGGTFFGGYLVKRLNLRFRGLLRLCMITTAVVFFLTLTLLCRCDNIPFVGVNVGYGSTNRSLTSVNLTSTCNGFCQCQSNVYDPVCGSDGLTYYSACYAGCQTSDYTGDRKVIYYCKAYHNCSCISLSSTPGRGPSAVEGLCEGGCQLLVMFLVVFGCIIFFTFTTSMPALAATLRCVPEKHRSFALGIQWILFRTLGMIPAPILFGALIDNACVVWQQSTSKHENGACKHYDNWAMAGYLLVLLIACKLASFGFLCVALWRYRSTSGNTTTLSTTVSGLSRSISEKLPIAKGELNADLDKI